MKKLLPILLAILLIPAHCCAEIELSSMTYDELVALRDDINLAMWQCQEWQEVEVPQGLWLVGEDIPAGHWTISAASRYASIMVGNTLDENNKKIAAYESDFYYYDKVTHPTYKYFDDSDVPSVDYELKDGTYVQIEDGSVVFTPYAGKPALGFR